MAVLKMKLASIIGIINKFEDIVNLLGSSGYFQPENVFEIYKNIEGLSYFEIKDNYAEEIKKILVNVGMIDKKIDAIQDFDFFSNFPRIQKFDKCFYKVTKKRKEKIDFLNNRLESYQEILDATMHFTSLSVSFDDIYSCRHIGVFFGKIPIECWNGNIDEENLMLTEFSRDEKTCYVAIFFVREETRRVIEMLKGVKFKNIDFQLLCKTPEGKSLNLKNEIKKIKKEIEKTKSEIEEIWEKNEKHLKKIFSSLKILEKRNQIILKSAKHGNKFLIVGWIPAEKEKEIEMITRSLNDLNYSTDSGEKILKFNPPTLLKNKKIFSPFEFFVGMYGFPCNTERDPTVFVAITYTLLFGIMFADFGQGFLLLILSLYGRSKKKIKVASILTICATSSMVFGFLFGSVFGFENVFDPIYKNLGFSGAPIKILEPYMTMPIIYSAIAIGAILLSTSICINTVIMFEKKRYADALFSPNGLSGLIFYLAFVFTAADMIFFKTGVVGMKFCSVFLVIPLLLMFMRDIFAETFKKRKFAMPKDLGIYFITNFFELLEVVLSYFSNTISFVRIGVFIFVHAGMMMVVFSLAEMVPPLLYIPVIVAGNIFVTVLEAMLVGIQVMRLEFCELFGRFFKGNGRKFEPI
jgi:V/A-type H+-transporting ATPase subunit I